jgi:protein-disulfide isomerase/plastocyanin
MSAFIKRNLTILIIGLVTVGVFMLVIVLGQKTPTESPALQAVDETTLIAAHTYILGDFEAPVTLVMFMDFKDPSCAEYYTAARGLYFSHKGDLRLVFRHLPNEQDEESMQAAVAAQVIGEQGGFWDYAYLLFENQEREFTDEVLGDLVVDLELDEDRFWDVLKNGNFDSLIRADIRSARGLNLLESPVFFLEGRRLVVENVVDFEDQVEVEIAQYLPPMKDTVPTKVDNNEAEVSKEPILTSQELKERAKTFDITFTELGWDPVESEVYVGQTVRWTNNTASDIVLEQLDPKFPELEGGIEIKAGKSFEFTVYKSNIWRYREKLSRSWGIMFIKPIY